LQREQQEWHLPAVAEEGRAEGRKEGEEERAQEEEEAAGQQRLPYPSAHLATRRPWHGLLRSSKGSFQ